MAGQIAVVNHIRGLDPARRNLDFGPCEGVLGPVDRALRHGRRGGHGKHLGLELVGRRGLACCTGIRNIGNPGEGDPARLGGEDLVRMRAVVIELGNRERLHVVLAHDRGRDRDIGLVAQGDVEAIHNVHPLPEQGRPAHQTVRHGLHGDDPALGGGRQHRHAPPREQRLTDTVEVGQVGTRECLAGLHRLRAPVSRRGDRATPRDLGTLDHIAERKARHTGSQAVATGRAGEQDGDLGHGGNGSVLRLRIAGCCGAAKGAGGVGVGGGDQTTAIDPRTAQRGAADSGVLRGGGAKARGNARSGDGDLGRGGVAAAATVDRDRTDAPGRQHRRGRGGDTHAARRADDYHRSRGVTQPAAAHGDARDVPPRQRGKAACTPRIEQVGGSPLDLILRRRR